MSIYRGTPTSLGWGGFERTFCFTGHHAAAFVAAGFLGGVALGVVLGAAIGALTGLLIPDPEPVSHILLMLNGMSVGIKTGAVIEVGLGIAFVVASKCNPCGFCFLVVYFQPPLGRSGLRDIFYQ